MTCVSSVVSRTENVSSSSTMVSLTISIFPAGIQTDVF